MEVFWFCQTLNLPILISRKIWGDRMIHTFPNCDPGPFPCCLAKIRRDEILPFILASFHKPEQWAAGICKILFYCALISPRTFTFRFSRSFLFHTFHLLEKFIRFLVIKLVLFDRDTFFELHSSIQVKFDVFAFWNDGENFLGKHFSLV